MEPGLRLAAPLSLDLTLRPVALRPRLSTSLPLSTSSFSRKRRGVNDGLPGMRVASQGCAAKCEGRHNGWLRCGNWRDVAPHKS